MEARMKHIRWAALFVAVVAMLLSGVGCEQKSTGDNNQNGGSIGSIQIVTGAINDTLEFLPADSASTTVTIIVSDDNGNVMRDVKVDISLANANLGVIEYVDTDRRSVLFYTQILYRFKAQRFKANNREGESCNFISDIGKES